MGHSIHSNLFHLDARRDIPIDSVLQIKSVEREKKKRERRKRSGGPLE